MHGIQLCKQAQIFQSLARTVIKESSIILSFPVSFLFEIKGNRVETRIMNKTSVSFNILRVSRWDRY